MLFFDCISVAIVAYVFTAILMEGGMIMYWYWQMLDRMARNGGEWLAKPLGYCGVCFSGQLGFWWYLLTTSGHWRLSEHIVFTAQTILFYLIIKRWATKNELS